MEELDKGAKAMKSGGSTRNAAKMVVMDMDHPDIIRTKDGRPGFIVCKAVEEKRAHDLIDIGYSASYDDPNSAYKWVSFQNANHSVSISDAFMKAVEADGKWETVERTTGKVATEYRARDLWKEISQAAWFCGDPGVQFTDTINKWHTTPENGRIKSSNPCSEFLHVDNTACNLCAINLTRFFDDDMKFLPARLEHAVRIFVTAQNAIIAKAEYPTELICQNSHALRPIGLNYGDLGALLMKLGFSYDSNEGRAVAGRLASLMTGTAYAVSARLAARVGAFSDFEKNRDAMLSVMQMHSVADADLLSRWGLQKDPLGDDIMSRSKKLWDEVYRLGDRFGYTISQATLQAPLGTISFLMDMDTTGIEPSFSLVSYKSLVGGGMMKIVNRVVPKALSSLGYSEQETAAICSYLEDKGYIEGAPFLESKDLEVFLCAMPAGPSKSCLTPRAHLEMMAAIQPLITCAQSKTVNMPGDSTPKDIADAYMLGWQLGLKCIALYRDGSKKSQPLSTKKEKTEIKAEVPPPSPVVLKDRRSMPDDRSGYTHRFEIGGHDGYITVNEYEDGKPGEVFIRLGKNGSTMAGLTDGFTKLLSIGLQYGVPLDKLITSFTGMRFDPSGMTRNPHIKFADSLFDYLFKFLDIKYYNGECTGLRLTSVPSAMGPSEEPLSSPRSSVIPAMSLDAPPCGGCGAITRRNGSCYLCESCGRTTGCS
jgi:ribonucleoside-diphosphate reductase alpha chain